MTPAEVLQLSKKLPKNKSVSKLISRAMKQIIGEDRKHFEEIVEGLYIDSVSDDDFDLPKKIFLRIQINPSMQ